MLCFNIFKLLAMSFTLLTILLIEISLFYKRFHWVTIFSFQKPWRNVTLTSEVNLFLPLISALIFHFFSVVCCEKMFPWFHIKAGSPRIWNSLIVWYSRDTAELKPASWDWSSFHTHLAFLILNPNTCLEI